MTDTPESQSNLPDDSSSGNDSPEDQLLADALDEYYRRIEEGTFDVAEFLAKYAAIKAQLDSFLRDVADVDRVNGQRTGPYRFPGVTPPQRIRYIGDYELLEEIARGGMGVVYKARQMSLRRIVAVKMILAGKLASQEDIDRFRREAFSAGQLRHPNIVGIYEIGEFEGQYFFSMEYIEGKDLAKLTQDNLFPATKSAEIVRTIAEAIQVVHSHGLLHRDLKPSNVLIESHSGTVRITDFGLAKSVNLEDPITATGAILGTPSYMSPEQATGSHDKIGPASDIYGIGAILYQLATGSPPFRGENPWDIARQVTQSDVIAPTRLNPKIPRDLETICLKCLEKDTNKRYATSQDLADDLGRFLRREPIHARPVGRIERTWRWCVRNPALAVANGAAIAGFLLLLIALIALNFLQRSHAFTLGENAKTLSNALGISEQRRREVNFRLAESERDKGLRLCSQGDIDHGCLWLARSLATAPDNATDLHWTIRMNLAAWQQELCESCGVFPGEGRGVCFDREGKRFATQSEKEVSIRAVADNSLVGKPIPHDIHFQELQFGFDGDHLLLGTQQKLYWCEYQDSQWKTRIIPGRIGGTIGVHITPENHLLMVDSTDKGLRVRDLMSESDIGSFLPADRYESWKVVFSDDAQYALSRPKRNQAVISDLKAGKTVGMPVVHDGQIWAARFSPNGKDIVTGCTASVKDKKSSDKRVEFQLWDVATGSKAERQMSHPESRTDAERILFSDNGERILTSTRFDDFRVWNRHGKQLTDRIRQRGNASSIGMTNNGRTAAYVATTNEARLFDIDANRTLGQSLGDMTNLSHLAIAPDGKHVLVGKSKGARLWRLPTRNLAFAPLVHGNKDDELLWLRFSLDGRFLVSAAYRDNSVQIWDPNTGQPLGSLLPHPFGVQCFAISPDGRYLAIGSQQSFQKKTYRGLSIRNLESREEVVKNFPNQDRSIHNVAFGSDGSFLATIDNRGEICIYDLAKNAPRIEPFGKPDRDLDGQVFRLALSSDDKLIASFGDYGSTISIWDVATGKRNCPVIETNGEVADFGFSVDRQILVTAGNQVRLWDPNTGEERPIEIANPNSATTMQFHPNGRFLATAHSDRTVRLWELETGKPVGRSIVLAETAFKLDFVFDGKLLLTSTENGAQLWDPFSGVQVGPTLLSKRLCCVSPNGRSIAGTVGNEVRVWNIRDPESMDSAAITERIEKMTATHLDDAGMVQPAVPNMNEEG